MAETNVLLSYSDVSRREDVMELVEILTPKEDWFLKNLEKTTAINTVHSTLVDTLRTPASAAVEEGSNYAYEARTTPTRLTNLTQEIAIPFRVSLVQQNISHYTGQDEVARQTTKALIDWANAAEFDIVRSTMVTGSNGTTQKMNGIIAGISNANTVTNYTPGTALTATIIKDLMKKNWEYSNGETATDLFCGSYLKNVIDGFSGNRSLTLTVEASKRELIDVVDRYQTGFGTLAIHLHRYVQQPGDTTGRILGVRPEKLAIAFLRKPYIQENLAVGGSYIARAVYGALTVEIRNQDCHFFATGFSLS